MPINGFTVGRDVTVTISTKNRSLPNTGLTSFTKKQDVTQKKVKLLTGVTKNLTFPDGWSGNFKVSRMDSTIDDYIAAFEAGFFAGSDTDTVNITETIDEPNGGQTQWQYNGVTLVLEDAGTASGDSEIEQTLSYVAERRIKLS